MDSAIGSHVEVVKEGTVWVATTSQLNRSKLSERRLTLARETPTLNQTGDVSENCVFLQTCKVSNGVQRKVQEFDLSDFEMVTSAYSSSSGTLGPTRSVIYRFTVHCTGGSHDFCTKEEHTMLAWVAALKQALTKPSDDETADLFAVTFQRQGRPNRVAGMTPSVARQASALLCISREMIVLLHPLTEDAIEQWPAEAVTSLAVNSDAQVLHLYVCETCQPRDGGVVAVTCPSGAQPPASAVISSLALQSCVRKGEREIVCEFQHTCETRFPSSGGGDGSRPASRASAGASSWCGSCGNLCDSPAAAPLSVGQLMKTSARQQLMSIYDQEEKVSPTRSFEEPRSADPEGYMIMKSEDADAEKTNRCGSMPLGTSAGAPSLAEKFRRTKSATFSVHNRLSRASHHQQVTGTRSLTHSMHHSPPPLPPANTAPTEDGEPTYTEPDQVRMRQCHLADGIPPLKPSAERTTSSLSSASAGPSEYYAASSVVSRQTAVANPSSAESCNSGNSTSSGVSSASTDSPCGGSGGEDETDEDGYSFMAFPEPVKRPLQPSASSRNYTNPLQAVHEARNVSKAAYRTRSSPSTLANRSRTHPGRTPGRARTASPSFSELEKRAAVATSRVRQRKDEDRGYVVPEPVRQQHQAPRRTRSLLTSSSASLPLPIPPDESYMSFSCNGVAGVGGDAAAHAAGAHGRKTSSSTSTSPDSGIGHDALAGGGDHDHGSTPSKASLIKKRVRQSNSLQKSRYSDAEPTHVLLYENNDVHVPPLPPKPADLPPIRNSPTPEALLRPTSSSPAPPLPPKPSVSPMPSNGVQVALNATLN